jgi:hypothetical protein
MAAAALVRSCGISAAVTAATKSPHLSICLLLCGFFAGLGQQVKQQQQPSVCG